MAERRQVDVAVGVERRQRGRPRVDQPMERVDLRLPPGLLDALCREAIRREVKVSILARRILAAHLLSVEKSARLTPP